MLVAVVVAARHKAQRLVLAVRVVVVRAEVAVLEPLELPIPAAVVEAEEVRLLVVQVVQAL